MAGYSAVVSLKNTIHRLLNRSSISFVGPSAEILKSAYDVLQTSQDFLEQTEEKIQLDIEFNSITGKELGERATALEREIRDAVWELEDAIESQSGQPLVDLQELREAVDCLLETTRAKAEEYAKEINNNTLSDDEIGPSTSNFDENTSEMIGFTDIYGEIRDMLVEHCASRMVVSISGMAGVGKTILAKKLLEDPLVIERYESCIFISVGPKPRPERFLQVVAAQLHDDDEEGRDLFERLNARKFLIVFDDVWDMYDMDFFTGLLEQKWDGSMILFTSRIRVYERYCERNFNLRFMNEKESWDLFRGKVFADKVCPPHLEKAGKKITANCEGLPLLIVTVADLMSRVDKTRDLWDEVAADKQNPIFEEAYDQLVEVLLPSYHHLPLRLKPCFLYMAVFPQNCEVVESRLTNLLSAEGFVDSKIFLRDILDFLVSHNVVLIRFEEFQYYGIKVFSLHSVFWHLCKKESRKEEFLHILNRYDDGLKESIERQRRVSFYKNVLLAIKDVFESVALVSNARSLLCTGVYHQYQVPLCIASLRLLKVLDALTIRFYEFPIELLKLVQLRYLALTYNGNLPSSISKISNLQSLIVHQHMSIKFTLAESYLPVEIWYLQELEHLEVTGRNLPDPPSGVVLPNLLTLLDVGPHSCTKAVLESTPSLKKLRVQTELTPDTAEPSLTIFRISLNLLHLNVFL